MQLLCGSNLIISGGQNLAILSEIAAHLTYDKLKEINIHTKISPQQYEEFIANLGGTLGAHGLLDANGLPTYHMTTVSPVV